MAELVPGVSHRDRFSGLGHDPPGEHFKPFRARQASRDPAQD